MDTATLPKNVDMEDVVMGDAATTTTVHPPRSAPPEPTKATVKIPDKSAIDALMLQRAKLGHKPNAPDVWRVVPPKDVFQVLGFSVPLPEKEDETMGDADQRQQQQQQVPSNAQAMRPLQYMRRLVYADTKPKIRFIACKLIEQGLPGLEARKHEAESVVDRLASELTAWAVYGETPPSLREERLRPPKPVSSNQPVPPLLAGRRERDATTLLKAQHGRYGDEGPLPSTNAAISDAHSSANTSKEAKAKHEHAVASVITVMAQAMTGLDPKTQKPRPATQILSRARELAAGDGVFLARRLADDESTQEMNRVIVVRAAEVQHLLRGPKDSTDGFMDETRKVLSAWRNVRVQTQDEDRGIKHRSIMPNGDNDETQGSSNWLSTNAAENLGKLLCQPPDERDLGLAFGNARSKYYRPESLEPDPYADPESDMRTPPIRTGIPLSRDLFNAFMHQHYVEMNAVSRWYLMPDMIMPTCPAMNLLLDGIAPLHMSLYTILEEYLALLRNAIDRCSTPAVRPPESIAAGRKGAVTATDLERARKCSDHVKKRGALACWLLKDRSGQQQQQQHEASSETYRNWFIPEAILPIPNSRAELEALYPKNDPTLHPWLRELVASPQLRGKSYEARLDAFSLLCATADRMHAIKEERKEKKKEEPPAEETTFDRAKAFIEKTTKPDVSRAGRAETILGLTATWLLMCMQRQALLQYHENLEQLRKTYGDGVDCGNGYKHVRHIEYYDKLFQLCLEHAVSTLESYEMILILINTRWIIGHKAVCHRVPMGMRLKSKFVANAHPDVVRRTLKRRHDNLNDRVRLDPSTESLCRGFLRLPDTSGSFPKDGDSEDWTVHKLVSFRIRPDCPTYGQMILFDHLIDGTIHTDGGRNGDPAVDDLTNRMRDMAVRDAKFAKEHPYLALINHELPGNAAPPSTKRDTSDSPDKTVSSEKRARPH